MKIYFTAAIYHRPQLINEYRAIKTAIQKLGHNEIDAYDVLNQPIGVALNESDLSQHQFFRHWAETISLVDVAVVEASFPSTVHIGLEIASLIERNKPVICLYLPKKNPTFVNEFHSQRVIKCEYTIETITESLRWGISEAEQMMSRRFTMNLPANLDIYMEQQVKIKNTTRSEYIRSLIENDMVLRKQP